MNIKTIAIIVATSTIVGTAGYTIYRNRKNKRNSEKDIKVPTVEYSEELSEIAKNEEEALRKIRENHDKKMAILEEESDKIKEMTSKVLQDLEDSKNVSDQIKKFNQKYAKVDTTKVVDMTQKREATEESEAKESVEEFKNDFASALDKALKNAEKKKVAKIA